MSGIARRVAAAAIACLPLTSFALDFGLDTSAGILNTDNLLRDNARPREADIATGEATLQLRERRRSFDADVDAGVVYRHYDVEDISDDVLPSINALLRADLRPDRFMWVLSEQLGQRAVNPNDGLLPSDRESVNIASTGPELRLPVSSAWWFTGGARAGRVDFENTPLDNYRYAARVGLQRELASGRLASLNVSQARTDFTGTARDFDIRSATLAYLAEGARGSLNASAGSSWVTTGDDTRGGFFGDLRFERRTASGLVALDVVHRLADSADVFRRQQDLDPDVNSVLDVVVSDQAVEETNFALSYSWAGRRTNLFLSGMYFSERYFNDDVSATRSGVAFNVQADFRLRPRLELTAGFEFRTDAPELNDRVQLLQEMAGLRWSFARTLALEGGIENYSREGGRSANYDERRYYARLRWIPREIVTAELSRSLDTPAVRRARLSR